MHLNSTLGSKRQGRTARPSGNKATPKVTLHNLRQGVSGRIIRREKKVGKAYEWSFAGYEAEG